jgi:hypothetical protein
LIVERRVEYQCAQPQRGCTQQLGSFGNSQSRGVIASYYDLKLHLT